MGDTFKQIWITETGTSAANMIGAWGAPSDLSTWLDQTKTQVVGDAVNAVYQSWGASSQSDVMLIYRLEAGDQGVPADFVGQLSYGVPDDFGFGLLRADGSASPTFWWLVDSYNCRQQGSTYWLTTAPPYYYCSVY
jgi:hypothetical protein